MDVKSAGIDHIYLTVSDLDESEKFYDRFMSLLDFRKGTSIVGGDPHIHFFNLYFSVSIRPVKTMGSIFDSYSPGLHHLCFQVDSVQDVDSFAKGLGESGIKYTDPRFYPEYSNDYYAVFVLDPDGIRLEVTNLRKNRAERMKNWVV